MKIEIWSDVACPWCYIGKHRFERALQAFEHRSEVAIEWKSFELAPEMAAISSLNVAQHLTAAKGIAPAQVQQMLAQVTQAGASEGLQLKFDQARPFNTRNAHQLLHYAKTVGKQIELAGRLFRASFTEGRQLGDTEVLIALAGEAGLDPAAVRDVLETGRYRQAVIDDEARAQALGVRGVPFFVVNGKYGISGAQASTVFGKGWKRPGWNSVPCSRRASRMQRARAARRDAPAERVGPSTSAPTPCRKIFGARRFRLRSCCASADDFSLIWPAIRLGYLRPSGTLA